MTTHELQQLPVDQLAQQLEDCEAKVFAMREQVTAGTEKDVRAVRRLRRECARVATVLQEKRRKALVHSV